MTDKPETDNPEEKPQEDTQDKPKRVRGEALRRLRKAAKRQVRDNSAVIAKKLLDLTLEGDMPSAKMLVSLIGKPQTKRKKPPKSKRGYSLALDLASDPPYDGPDEDDDSYHWRDPREDEPSS